MAITWRPLGVDADGRVEWHGWDDDTNSEVIRTDYLGALDPKGIVEDNRRYQNHFTGYTPSKDLKHVANIPIALIDLWKSIWGVDPTARGNEKLLARLLNDSDLRGIRTGLGHVDFKER